MTSFVDRVKTNAADFAVKAKAAAQLTWKQAERVKLTRWNLPAAYAALGKQVHSANCNREGFAESHQQIDGLFNDLRGIEQAASNQPSPSGVGDRVKGVTASIRRAFERRLVNRRLTEAFARLGESIFKTQGEPRELVQPIADRTSRVRELDQQIAELAKVGAGQVVTPKRIQVAAIAGVLLVAGLLISQSLVTNDIDKRIPSSEIADNSEEGSAKPSSRSTTSSAHLAITTDYYPFHPGTVRKATSQLSLGSGRIETIVEERYGADDTITKTTLSQVSVLPDGKRQSTPTTAKINPLQYRIKDGFIETGSRVSPTNELIWQPILKIGARQGDSWRNEALNSVLTVLTITPDEVVVQEERKPAATIRTTTRYRRGLGPIRQDMIAIDEQGKEEPTGTVAYDYSGSPSTKQASGNDSPPSEVVGSASYREGYDLGRNLGEDCVARYNEIKSREKRLLSVPMAYRNPKAQQTIDSDLAEMRLNSLGGLRTQEQIRDQLIQAYGPDRDEAQRSIGICDGFRQALKIGGLH